MTGVVKGPEPATYSMINFEETELRLGLPGGAGNGNDVDGAKSNGKRGFSETVDLKLNLSTKETGKGGDQEKVAMKEKAVAPRPSDPAKPPSKAQVVGWPPIRSFRKNVMAVQKNNTDEGDKSGSGGTGAAFVKVSMDGAPYLRKVDLKLYKSYQELSDALGKMFSSFTIGSCGSQGTKDFMNESKLIDLLNSSEYVSTYEDKDGDWMLVGDVPWEMFVDSCKRLRIMKGSEAIGLGFEFESERASLVRIWDNRGFTRSPEPIKCVFEGPQELWRSARTEVEVLFPQVS